MKQVSIRRGWRAHAALCILIFIAAFAVRVQGIDFGLPYAQLPDETGDITASLLLARGETPPYAYHRVAWPLLQLPLHALHFVYERLSHPAFSTADFEALYYTNRGSFILSARIYSAFFSTLGVVVLYAVGLIVTKRRLDGVLCAGVLLLNPEHVYLAHFALPDAISTFWVALLCLGCVIVARSGKRSGYILVGAAAGAALLMRLNLLPLVVTLGASAHLVGTWLAGKRSLRWLLTRWLWALAAFAIAQILLNPLIILRPALVASDIQFIFTDRYTGTNPVVVPHADTTLWDNLRANYALPLTIARPYLVIAACVGVLFAFGRRQWSLIGIAFAGLVFTVSLLPAYAPRTTYWLAVTVPVSLLAAYAVYALWTTPRAILRVAALAIGLAGVVWMGGEVFLMNSALSRTTTQMLAYDYITAHIPEGTPIMQAESFIYSVPLSRTRESMQRVATLREVQNAYSFFLEHPALLRRPAFDVYGTEYLTFIRSDAQMADFLRDNQIRYIVETDYCGGVATYENASQQSFPTLTDAIRQQLHLEFVASPFDQDRCLQNIENRSAMEYMRDLTDWKRVGPILRVYRVLSNP